jgi:hypothetical protein
MVKAHPVKERRRTNKVCLAASRSEGTRHPKQDNLATCKKGVCRDCAARIPLVQGAAWDLEAHRDHNGVERKKF